MIDQLRQRFEQPGVRLFRRDRLDMVELSNAAGSTVITTLGATVLSYIPAGGDETIWVSDTACYDGSRPVRGGIPVCWPWFGAHPDDASLPAHGFARHAYWDLVAVESGDRSSLARFRLESDRETLRHWPHPFRLELVVTLGDALRLELQAHNPGTETWTISEALHSYFRVTDARRLTVSGLEGL
ncbi:MAG TPA: D-hexose-6-phosphate mutarotase, partial [Chromatiales bacterium]|nr:D-hexose-6-phosphate mutarotase [Chromatiales bacterium]